jgi:hypothetical protein
MIDHPETYATARTGSGPAARCCPIVELRQYALRPGQRDVLIELFDRELVESQEAVGMQIIGQFRDLDRPDRFVWLRGFADMGTRLTGLHAFYGGPVWRSAAKAANATMLDVDDVLLLRPAAPGGGFASTTASHLITATVYPVRTAAEEEALLGFLHTRVDPVLADAGREAVAELRTESSVNDFPALPVREGEHVVVRFARHADVDAHAAYRRRLAQSWTWREEVGPELRARLAGPPQRLRLEPTPRSWLR